MKGTDSFQCMYWVRCTHFKLVCCYIPQPGLGTSVLDLALYSPGMAVNHEFRICMVVISTLWICMFPQHVLWYHDIQTRLSDMLTGKLSFWELCLIPALWGTDGCRDAIHAWKQALRYLDSHSTLENLIPLKRLTTHPQFLTESNTWFSSSTHMYESKLSMCHHIWLEKSFLSAWREAKVISILKPNCDHFLTASYRPVNLCL
jgi:hypothetical protein